MRGLNQGELPAPRSTLLLLPFSWREEQADEMRSISCESNFFSPQIPEARKEEGEEEEEGYKRTGVSVGETIKGFMQPIHFGMGRENKQRSP